MHSATPSQNSQMSKDHPVRFGIIGCAEIAKKLSRAIHRCPNTTLLAVGSRSIGKAKLFVADLLLPDDTVRAYGSYEEVLDDPEVDAVYIPLPTSLHRKWAMAAAERKKHVLLEKPVALCVSDLDAILAVCEANAVQFMDGTMWLHHLRTSKMKELLSHADLFGRPLLMHGSSTFMATSDFLANNIRVNPDLDSLGALGDLGWYCISAILWAMDYTLPATVTAYPPAHTNPRGVILACAASLHWDTGATATFHCSFLCNTTMSIELHGTCGSLLVKDLAIPYEEPSACFEFTNGAHLVDLHIGWSRQPEVVTVESEGPQEVAMVYRFAEMVRVVRDLGGEPDGKWGAISRGTQLVVDAVRSSIETGFKTVGL